MVSAHGAAQYIQEDVEGASPIRLVIMAYDLAIQSCEKKDFDTSNKAVLALQNSLDFDFPEAAGRLLSVYQWVGECLRKGDFEAAKNVLFELREAWSIIEKRISSSRTVQLNVTGGLVFENEDSVK